MSTWIDRSASFAPDDTGHLGRCRTQGGLGPAIGLSLACASSLVLWEGLGRLAHWAARTLF